MSESKSKALSNVYQYITTVMSLTDFDWANVDEGLQDILEELDELKQAQTAARRFEEAGDVLFAVLNWFRWLGIEDPEAALSAAQARFQARLERLQARAAAEGKAINQYTTAELKAMWEVVKKEIGSSP